jgi:hypothetical protein
MKQKCMACGAEKDTSIKEVYPYADDGLIEKPIEPLMTVDCQGPCLSEATDWRVVTVCHQCFHRLDVDMWISEACWRSLTPVTPFEQSPKLPAERSA